MVLLRDNHPSQMYQDMKARGYWCAEEFFPGCYKRVLEVPQRKLKCKKTTIVGLEEPEYVVEFCGLVATGRIVRCETDGEESINTGGKTITFLCIGYENGQFQDLVVHGAKGYLLGYVAVAGTAVCKKGGESETLQVKTIRGVSLHSVAFPTDI
jgi:hypothetical protein